MKNSTISFILFIIFSHAYSQNATIKGKITDSSNNEDLFGVNIITNEKQGATTDFDGNYIMEITPGKKTLNFYYVGYQDVKKEIDVKDGETLTINIQMGVESELINEVVVSAGKFEQKLSDVTVSMEVLKAQQIENINTTSMENAINQIPGIEIMDDQPSIRGGSGYSFGAGSRVMVLMDDLPILSPDAGDVKWNFIPVENISQVEVIKGASSALFGSSALNGVINIRTAFPKDKPETKFSLYNGLYMNPKRKDLIWWGNNQQMFSGANFLHSRKIGNLDFVTGAHVFNDNGYRKNENEERARINMNLKYRDKKVRGLIYGINSNFLYFDKLDFIMWDNDTTGGYTQSDETITSSQGARINIDPYISYTNVKGSKHSLKTRYYYVANTYKDDSTKDSKAGMYYAQYQFQKKLGNSLHWISGISTTFSDITSNLFGNHYSSNFACFTQFDKKIKRLSLSAGLRTEYFRIDSTETVSKIDLMISNDTLKLPVIPVVRAGANYQIAKYTFIRASFGQGFRFPSVAEKYTSALVSSLRIFPNPNLRLEKGWSAEIGIKQGVKIGNWNGYLDIAGFWTEYEDMMEYAFGVYNPETYKPMDPWNNPVDSAIFMEYAMAGKFLECYGFQSRNVGNAKITGVDANFTSAGEIFGIPTTFMIGYVYTNPIDLTVDPNDTTRSTDSNMLKYRFYHSVKGDVQFEYKKLTFGLSYVFNSYMVNVDDIFLKPMTGDIYIVPGYSDYRERHNTGYEVWDARIAYNLTETSKVSIVVKNLLNEEYMTRPTDLRPPRNIAIQYVLSI